ncbi:2-methylene-furan-3-one reductase [Phytophthora citrophthora]|uniref:2-methylene-furan-3-one reductase n=1 Tax=Phytophthora citrophthora TaxID=4793 RepID=A0AAD9GRB2_9STRA|nr:2-methylene-furan-3-one reductase [Phytophthora citrophthora]
MASTSSTLASSSPTTFRAYQFEEFGDVLQVVKLGITQQQPLKPSEVCVRVYSAGVNPVDWKFVEYGSSFLPTAPSADRPFRVGFDVSGVVESVGSEVNTLHVGDAVYGQAPFGGPGGFANYIGGCGTFAEFVNIEAKYLALKPSKLSFTEAAAVSNAAQTSYQALVESANLQSGERVLILGGSGGAGVFAVQLAKELKASEVIATTSSRNFELLKSLGAERTIDYTTEDWSEVIEQHSIDVIYDCVGQPSAWNEGAQKVLKPNTGRYVSVQTGAGPASVFIESPIAATKLPHFSTQSSAERLATLTQLFESGSIVVPIHSEHAFEDLLGAFKQQKSNRARGKIVLKVRNNED